MASSYTLIAILIVSAHVSDAFYPYASIYGGYPLHYGFGSPFAYGYGYPYGYHGYHYPRTAFHNHARSYHAEGAHLSATDVISPFAKYME